MSTITREKDAAAGLPRLDEDRQALYGLFAELGRKAAGPPLSANPPAADSPPAGLPLPQPTICPRQISEGGLGREGQVRPSFRSAREPMDAPRLVWLLMLVCLPLAALCFWQALPDFFSIGSSPRVEAGPPTKTRAELRMRAIKDYDVGMRALGQNPLRDQVETVPEPDPTTSRKLVLRLRKESGGLLRAKLLRPVAWIEAAGVKEGATFFLNLPEMGAVGEAYVEAILPCPPIEKGPGNVVTGVFAHEADPETRILSITLANGAYIKGVTDNHPFYSVDRNEFVEIGRMREGESVKIQDGVTRIAQIDSRYARPGEMLYNLETHNEHVYQVTTAGILVHNSCSTDDFVRLNRARQLADDVDANRIFKLTDDELELVGRIRGTKQNLQIYRTNQKAGLGDFLIIDRSNPRKAMGFLVDLKASAGSAGFQLRKRLPGKRPLQIVSSRTIFGHSGRSSGVTVSWAGCVSPMTQ